jgi:uncharacterized protein YprB with RNaseH-like and TPR domain
MGDLAPIAFDIETSGLEPGSVITVAGLAFELGEVILLNTAGRPVDAEELEARLRPHSTGRVELIVCEDEYELLVALAEVSSEQINTDAHYLTAYHGETWNGGFDLPFVRTSCVTHSAPWPFPDMAYADVLDIVDRFNTGETRDLVGVYDLLISEVTCDPFTDSGEAVDAFENGEWEPLLLHNLADIQRTRELAVLASEYVPKSDFRMKNLTPPR